MSWEWVLWTIWILWILQGLACLYNIGAYSRLMDAQDANLDPQRISPAAAPAVVIIPMKGVCDTTRAFLRGLLHQDYPGYRLLFCYESDHDPAAQMLREELGLGEEETCWRPGNDHTAPGLEEVILVACGKADKCGQKVHNQLAAMRLINGTEALIAFADADMLCGPDWLSQLTAPLNRGTHHLAGAYRWFIPEANNAPTLFASVINASVATLGGREFYNVLWGGSMALTRQAYDRLDVPRIFSGSLNDDLQLARSARRAGMRPAYIRSLLVPSPISFTWKSFFEFARRQYYQVRHYTPKLYAAAMVGTALYTAGWLSSIAVALSGYTAAWIPWIIVNLFIDQPRAALRIRLAGRLFDSSHAQDIRKTRVLEHLATPLWMALHGLLAASALLMGHVSWSGVTYRVYDRQKIDILSRSDAMAE